MPNRISLLIAAAIIVPTAAWAVPSWRDFKDVSNTSFVEPDGLQGIHAARPQFRRDAPEGADPCPAAERGELKDRDREVPVDGIALR